MIGSTKIPKFILQGCPTSILSFCTITIFEGQVFVNITSNEMNISEKTLFNLPLKSTMKGLLENLVHDTRTAFPVGKVVVGGTVAVVTSGADVVSIHSNSLQGQPAEQFSCICNKCLLKNNRSLPRRGSSVVLSWIGSNNRLHTLYCPYRHEHIFPAWDCYHLCSDSNLDSLPRPKYEWFSNPAIIPNVLSCELNKPGNHRSDWDNRHSHPDNWARTDNLKSV